MSCPQHQEIFAPSTSIQENWSGYFILFRNRVSMEPIRGALSPGREMVVRIAGQEWLLMKSGELSMCRLLLLLLIFMVRTGPGRICLQTACLHWMQKQGNASGTTRPLIMIYGIAITDRLPIL